MNNKLCNLLYASPKNPFGEIDIEKAADHLLLHGVLAPRCKIGQVFWWYSEFYNKVIRVSVKTIRYNTDGFVYVMESFHGDKFGFMDKDFGARIYSSESEAKEILRKRRKEKAALKNEE